MPEVTGIKGITHVSLSVSNLEQSYRFYREVLGLPVLVEPFEGEVFDGREAMLLAGRVALCLQEHSSNAGESFDPSRTGLDHLAFLVDSPDVLAEWGEKLDAAGVQHSEIKNIPPFGSIIELRDPDGVQVELHSLEAASG